MPRDYKSRPRPRRPTKRGAPGWAWMLAGLAIGLFVAFLVYLRDHQEEAQITPVAGSSSLPEAQVSRADPPRQKEAHKPRFEFYTILPEMEVPVAAEQLPPRTDKGGKQPPEAGTYLLQVASFKSHQEADRLKASLALLGMEAKIQTVSIDGTQTWHRVRLGPFDALSQAKQARRQLQQHDLDGMILKVNT